MATTWSDPGTGLSYILIIHQALYFGTQLDHLLINVNQIRITGLSVCDDPYDRYRNIGIETSDIFIPFSLDGNTLNFESHVPTEDELTNCPYIILTDDTEWDPNSVDLTDPRPTSKDLWNPWTWQIIPVSRIHFKFFPAQIISALVSSSFQAVCPCAVSNTTSFGCCPTCAIRRPDVIKPQRMDLSMPLLLYDRPLSRDCNNCTIVCTLLS